MLRRHVPTAFLLSGLLAFAATAAVLAKGDAIVTLDASLPVDAEPGSEITVGWTVETLGDNGERFPFNAEGMFIRLVPATGEATQAIGTQNPLGHYVATVTVPDGGIADVQAGLRGESCSGGTCQVSDMLFAIDDRAMPLFVGAGAAAPPADAAPVPVVPAEVAPAPAPAGPVNAVGDPLPLALIGVVLAAVAFGGLTLLRARGRAFNPGAGRS